jgi:hypothetical protein
VAARIARAAPGSDGSIATLTDCSSLRPQPTSAVPARERGSAGTAHRRHSRVSTGRVEATCWPCLRP